MNPKIIPLPFDSDLFGYEIGKCQIENYWNEEDFLNQAAGYQLVYIFSKNPIQINSGQLSLSDIKLSFEKKLVSLVEQDLEIALYFGENNEELASLALESGVFSRFKTDPKFVKGEYEKLYRLWIENAMINKEVLVTEDFSGFVSCHTSGTESSIGLIAVDKTQRGKGWGKRLVKAAENFAFNQGALTLRIATQEANIPAVTLYRSLGYRLVDRVHIYHCWKA